MFGVVEGFAIAGGIAAIISAFKDGRSLFRSWRAQRKARKNLRECDEVQESLRKNPPIIERTYDELHRKLGATFGKGDGRASTDSWWLALTCLRYCSAAAPPISTEVQPDDGEMSPDVVDSTPGSRSEQAVRSLREDSERDTGHSQRPLPETQHRQ